MALTGSGQLEPSGGDRQSQVEETIYNISTQIEQLFKNIDGIEDRLAKVLRQPDEEPKATEIDKTPGLVNLAQRLNDLGEKLIGCNRRVEKIADRLEL